VISDSPIIAPMQDVPDELPAAPSVIPGVERILVAHDGMVRQRNAHYRECFEWISRQPAIAVDVETTGLRVWGGDRVVGIAVYAPTKSFYFPFRHGRGEIQNHSPALIREDFGPLLARTDNVKINFNNKFDQEALYQDTGTIWGGQVYDASLSAHLLNENEPDRTLKGLSDKYLSADASAAEARLQEYMGQLLGISTKNKAFLWYLPPDQVSDYACADVELAWSLFKFHLPYLQKHGLFEIYKEVSQYAQIITEMECRGALIDLDIVDKRHAEAVEQYQEHLARLREQLAMPDFNPNSAPQKAAAFGLVNGKTGKASTSKDVIEARLAKGPWDMAEPAKTLITAMQWERAKTHYYEKYRELMEPKPYDTRRHVLHCSFRLAQVRTPRLSCTEPNLQAVPRQSSVYKVKDVFTARPGYVLLEADYSQAELRQLADEAHIRGMADILNNHGDLHGDTAAKMTALTGREIARDYAKRMNFGAVYGLGGAGLSDYLHIAEYQGQEYMNAWHAVWPEVKRYSIQLQQQAYDTGELPLWSGRKKHYNGFCDCGKRGCREWHKAMSHRIQGGVGEMIRVAMQELSRIINDSDDKRLAGIQMLLQVHDSVLFEIPVSSPHEAVTTIRTVMEEGPGGIFLQTWPGCPPKIDMKWGPTWGTAHDAKWYKENLYDGGYTDETDEGIWEISTTMIGLPSRNHETSGWVDE
jgi:DNA polymerase-1